MRVCTNEPDVPDGHRWWTMCQSLILFHTLPSRIIRRRARVDEIDEDNRLGQNDFLFLSLSTFNSTFVQRIGDIFFNFNSW